MKVKDLIEALQQQDPEMDVVMSDQHGNYYYPIDSSCVGKFSHGERVYNTEDSLEEDEELYFILQ